MSMPEEEQSGKPSPARGQRSAFRRKAGCLLACLTEPLVMLFLLIGSVIGGYLWGRRSARHQRNEKNGAK